MKTNFWLSFNGQKILWFILLTTILWAGVPFWLIGQKHFSNYAMIKFKNGDIYIGRLYLFPRAKIVNPWYFQIQQDQKGKVIGAYLTRWETANWLPSRPVIYFNKNEVVLFSYLKPDSYLVKSLQKKDLNLIKLQ